MFISCHLFLIYFSFLFYFLSFVGAPPFERDGVKDTLQCIINGQYSVPLGISAEAIDFMKCLIQLVRN